MEYKLVFDLERLWGPKLGQLPDGAQCNGKTKLGLQTTALEQKERKWKSLDRGYWPQVN